jgi:cyclopropane fatty-acyl-phospholipid synthase-like methyltransferase
MSIASSIRTRIEAAFSTSRSYWERRYRQGGKSGPGSHGRLAEFKARVLNEFVAKHGVQTVVELGCGDGAQLSLANYPHYLGLDVSKTALEICRSRFRLDETKRFARYPMKDIGVHDLAISIDVIYHLVEDDIFATYMNALFGSAGMFVIVYSSNIEGERLGVACRHRTFTRWIDENARLWRLREVVRNPHPFDRSDPHNTSFCDFYVYERNP